MTRSQAAMMCLCLSVSATAFAGKTTPERFSLGADVGATARYFDSAALSDPLGFGLDVGVRSELNLLLHLKGDVVYTDGAIFSAAEHRQLEFSVSGSSPALLVFALDVHELYGRLSSRPGDDLLYLHTGLGIKVKALGRFKGGLGFTYIQGDGPRDLKTPSKALGAYAGLEHMYRSKVLDTNLRGAVFVAFDDGKPHVGLTTDADLMIKAKVGPVSLGPRIDVGYRNLALTQGSQGLFAQDHEFTGRLSLAVLWGTGV